MSEMITNDGKFNCGCFVLNEHVARFSFTEGEGFVVTSKESKGLLNSILTMVSEANNYIKICSFIIDNKEVVEALKKYLKEGKISVFILTAVDDKKIKSDMLDEEESAELSKSRHFEFIDELVKAGAHVRASVNAHAKFVVKDGNEALLMSANLTEPSLNNNEKGKYPNDESGIILRELEEIKSLERIFDSIFLYGTEFRKFINLNDKTQLISKNENEIRKSDFPGTDSNLLWSYEHHYHLIYENLISIIESAKESVKLSTYSIVELSNLPELIGSIKSFITDKKGRIQIFCRAMNHRPDHLAACKYLKELGVEIFGDMYNHSKGVSVDDKDGLIFTANIDGKHGLKSGFEVGYRITSSNNAYSNFNSFLDYQIKTAPYVFSVDPNKDEVFSFYYNWYKEKEIQVKDSVPDSFEIKVRSNASYSKEFELGIKNHPIFYTVLKKADTRELQFEINGKTYLIEMLNDNTFALKQQLQHKDIVNAEKYILFYKEIKLTTYES